MIKQLNAILASEGIPPLVAGALQANSRRIISQDDLRTCLSAFGPAEGWLCLTDQVIEIAPDYDFGQLSGRNILSGELAAGDRTLHLRQQNDAWIAVELQRIAATDGYLVEQHLFPVRGSRKLRYEVCWSAGDDGILKPNASRFAGFATGGDAA
jgi:hypothetical protein